MQTLVLGGETLSGYDIVDLHSVSYFSGADAYFRSEVTHLTEMRSYGMIVNMLWYLTTQPIRAAAYIYRKAEGVYIVESEAPTGDCKTDNRGPPGNRVCLKERPTRSYWVQATSNFDDKKIYNAPGLEYLNNTEPFHGIYLGDVVRSSLWWDEKVRPDTRIGANGRTNDYEPTPDDYDDAFSHTRDLNEYSKIPGVFRIPVCRSWNGETISDTNTTHHANAPCLSGSLDPTQRSS
jgi:hypothetical protein